MNTKAASAPFFNTIKHQVISPIVEKTIAEHFSAPPPHNLEPVHVWKEKARLRLTDLFSGQGAIDKMTAGFDAIAVVLRGKFSHAEYDALHEEWKQGVERWISIMQTGETHSEISEIRAECLQEIMGISEETMVHFYEAGNDYFKQQEFQKASEAFYVVISLDHRRYSAWIAMGLSEARNKHCEHALYSFAMASITNISSPYPYIYSAECCLESERHEEAINYLSLAKESLEKSQLSNKKSLLMSISKLQESFN